MVDIIAGLAILLISTLLFWKMLPNNGEPHRLIRTLWAPYIGTGFTAGFCFAVAIIVSGVVQLLA